MQNAIPSVRIPVFVGSRRSGAGISSRIGPFAPTLPPFPVQKTGIIHIAQVNLGVTEMFVLIGIGVLFGAIIVGFTSEGGKIAALMQVNEFIIIGGAALGSMLIANPLSVVISVFKGVLGTLKPSRYSKAAYMELLKMLYDMFMMARKEGLMSLDSHVERPEDSSFFSNYPLFFSNHHAVAFLADTMKVIVSGSVSDYNLMELMDIDLETTHEEELKPSQIVAKMGDAMPGFGIVAAVLGVVNTMAAIGGKPEVIGEKVGAALVGTFLGILMAYGLLQPLSISMEASSKAGGMYMNAIKFALLSFARGDAPLTAVEFARRNIEPSVRPSFSEMEQFVKNMGGGDMAAAA